MALVEKGVLGRCGPEKDESAHGRIVLDAAEESAGAHIRRVLSPWSILARWGMSGRSECGVRHGLGRRGLL